MPMDRMLRIICASDSSKAKKTHRSLRRQAASTKEATTLVFPVPAVPERRMLLPLKYPFPPNIVSRRGMPVETLWVVTGWFNPIEVIGSTEIPLVSIKKGYSFVPWVVPLYLTTRRRRVESWSVTRWSRKMTQSETYSSRPWRVNVFSPFSPVTMVVMPLSLSHRKRRRSSTRRIRGLGNPAKSDSIVSRTTRFASIELGAALLERH